MGNLQSDLTAYLVAKLDEMQTTKAQQPIVPNMVTKQELFDAIDKDIKDTLNSLFTERKIKVHKTVHAPISYYVELVKEK